MNRKHILARIMAASAGIALAAVMIAYSLSDLAAHPQLPGTNPNSKFTTLVSVGTSSDFSDGGSIRYESVENWILPPDVPVTAMATQRRISYANDSEDSVALGIYSGPLFDGLGVRIVGHPPFQSDFSTSLKGASAGPLEIAISERIASRWFGSVDAAFDQIVKVDSLLAEMGTEPVEFRVSAVFDEAFEGPSSATQADVWIPLNSWPDVIVPGHQGELLRTLPIRFLGAMANDHVSALESRIRSRMLEDSEGRQKRLLALPGLGVEAHTRLVYARWAESLQWFAGALFLMLGTFVLSIRALELARRHIEDATRAALGENDHSWWQRQSMNSMHTLGIAFGSFTAAIGLVFVLSDRFALPMTKTILNIPTLPGSWLLIGSFVMLIGWVPLVLHRIRRKDSGVSELRLMRNARAIIAVTTCLVAALAAVSTASIIGLEKLADRNLGVDTTGLSVASRVDNSAVSRVPRSFDGRDAGPLLSELSMMDIAAARASPIDRVATIQGTHRFDGEPMSFLFGVNFVSANYFDVLGVADGIPVRRIP